MSKHLKVKLIGEGICKEFELPNLENIDAMIFAWLEVGCRVEVYLEEIELSDDED